MIPFSALWARVPRGFLPTFVQAVTSWIPTEFWVIVGLSIGSLVVLGIVSWLKE